MVEPETISSKFWLDIPANDPKAVGGWERKRNRKAHRTSYTEDKPEVNMGKREI
jgi:hypothetical protein